MPIIDGKYVAPTWANGSSPAINAAELQAMSDTLAANQVPTNHAVAATTYGLGSNTKFGHVALTDTPSATYDQTKGVAATPKSVKAAADAADAAQTTANSALSTANGKAPASVSGTYTGTGTFGVNNKNSLAFTAVPNVIYAKRSRAVDNNPLNKRSGAFIADGSLTVNLQNGARRSLSVKFANADEEFSYKVNNLWYGTKIALDEGLILPNGEEYYIQQGVFVLTSPEETVAPNEKSISYSLADKWANIDGTLYGNLEGTYEVPVGSHVFSPVVSLFAEDRGNGEKVDPIPPVFTSYYNGMTQDGTNGETYLFTETPYTLTLDGDSGTIGEVVTGLSAMLNAWVGYDSSGALRIDPSQDDILDNDKAVLWEFREDETVLLGLTYTSQNTEVYNDYIVVGEQLDDYSQPCGRAQNFDPASDTNINLIGRKTFRESKPDFYTDQMCKDYAVWKMKRAAALQKSVTISCGQIFHIQENNLVTIPRSDKEGNPAERHLIVGFSRPLASNGAMTINAVSVNDFPQATVTGWPE